MREEVLADGIVLIHGDFREIGQRKIDHLITDSPYEQRSHDASGSIRRNDGTANPLAIPFEGIDTMRDDLLLYAKENCSGWLLSFCTTEGVAIWRDAIELHELKYKTPMIWVKPNSMPKFNGQGPAHGHECIVSAWCGPGYSKWNGGGRRGVFTHNMETINRDHPTQKPVSLMSEIVCLFSNPGELVGDVFMGSGSTGVSCVRLARRFLGVEINETYFDVACRRIEQELKQTDLFVDIPLRAKQEALKFE